MLKLLKHLGLSLLLFWLCMFTVFAQELDPLNKQQKQDPPAQPILDAPSLQIPSQPYYTTNLQELGYESLEELLTKSVQAQSYVTSLAWSPSGQLASGSDDGTINLWDAKTGALLSTLLAQRWVNSLAWSPSGQLASGSMDGTIKLWDAKTGALLNTLSAQGRVNSLAWSPSLGIKRRHDKALGRQDRCAPQHPVSPKRG